MKQDVQECKVTQTLDVVTRLSHVVKRGLLKQRIYRRNMVDDCVSRHSILSHLDHEHGDQSLAGGRGRSRPMLIWVGTAVWQIRRLDAEYAAQAGSNLSEV